MARLLVDTFEWEGRRPVVRHVFYGRTRKAAQQILRAHLSTDRFLRACEVKRNFSGIKCHNVKRWSK